MRASLLRHVLMAVGVAAAVAALFLFVLTRMVDMPTADAENSTVIKQRETTFIAVGDIMLSRGVAREIEEAGTSDHPFSVLLPELLTTDFNFGNFESPVSGHDSVLGEGLVFNTKTKNIDGVLKANFKVLNLANNHAFDQGLGGLRNTRQVFSELGILTVGVGESQEEAWEPRIIVSNGIRIAFIGASFSSINDLGVTRNAYIARIEDINRLKLSIEKAKAESDFVVVTMHAGTEYRRNPNISQINFARSAIDAGADIVIGAHPHWIQTVENYRGRWIFYSLGNFVFDQRAPETTEGLMLRIKLAAQNADTSGNAFVQRIELIPVVLEQVGVPRLATPLEKELILNKIGVLRSEITSEP